MIDKKVQIGDKKFTLGVFNDEGKLLNAVRSLRKKEVNIFDCYTPFPVHHLDKEMGIKRTNLTVIAFICGALGTTTGFSLAYYMNVLDWPMIIGGKPMDVTVFTSFIPIMFELTVLFTAFGMVIAFFTRSSMIHGFKQDILDLRQTDDLMLLAIEVNEDQPISDDEIKSIINNEGALEIRERGQALEVTY
ncbi:DUF3341 domain-containing protein [bacterium]|nr:DUF3341 domain-containing protein [bacterium]